MQTLWLVCLAFKQALGQGWVINLRATGPMQPMDKLCFARTQSYFIANI